MKFCSNCGEQVIQRIPEGDSRPRYVCEHCDTIHYQNPNIVAGVVPVWGEKVLLCRRAIEPRLGYWTLPAGFMENGESVEQAARRETLEEACAQVEDLQLYSMIDVPHINQVHIFYRANLVRPGVRRGHRKPGSEVVRRSRYPVVGAGFPDRQTYPRMLFPRPAA